nr:chloride channel protein [uncultured Agathobaculum sp.]
MDVGYWKKQAKNALIFARWCAFAVIIGVVVGAVGAVFHHALEWAGEMRETHDWLLYLLPLVGVFIAFWYKKADMPLERGTNFILTSVRENHPVRLRLAPSIFVTSVLTHLCGGSAGREGAALQLGGAISGNIGHWMRLDDRDSRTITMCGMAAGFAALFRLGGETTAFAITGIPQTVDALLLAKLVLFGVVCAVLSAVVCIVFHRIGHLFKHYIPNQYACMAAGGAAVVLISLLLGTRDYNGAGMAVIERAVAGEADYAAFFIKLVLTAITIGVGYKGGEIVPVLFIGATFGAAYGGFFGLAPSFAAGLGMTAVFCGVTNSPLTSVLLAYELFGGQSLALFALVIAVAYMLSGYYGLYSEQKILYSKMRPQFIDRKTK